MDEPYKQNHYSDLLLIISFHLEYLYETEALDPEMCAAANLASLGY